MRVIDVEQGTKEWDKVREGIPTASKFGKIITPAKLGYSSQADSYACELIAVRLGVEKIPYPTTLEMDNGTEKEPLARGEYQSVNGVKVKEVGFVFPDGTNKFGCSPDGLVGDDGMIEIKCPNAETLIAYHAAGVLPSVYIPQVQGSLYITEREWCDFYVWHEKIEPFQFRVYPDEKFQVAFSAHLVKFLGRLEEIETKVTARELLGFDTTGVTNE